MDAVAYRELPKCNIVLGRSPAAELVLPKKFADTITNRKPMWLSCKTWDSLPWNLKLESKNGTTMFTMGWELFCKAYALTEGESLHIWYDTDMTFRFTMFTADGDEKGVSKSSYTPYVEGIAVDDAWQEPRWEETISQMYNSEVSLQNQLRFLASQPVDVGPVRLVPAATNGTLALSGGANRICTQGALGGSVIKTYERRPLSHRRAKVCCIEVLEGHLSGSEDLNIPRHFALCQTEFGVVKRKFCVDGNNIWPVWVVRMNGSSRILAGWKTFATDNHVTAGDLLYIERVAEDAEKWRVEILKNLK